jgi:hypothetical protein
MANVQSAPFTDGRDRAAAALDRSGILPKDELAVIPAKARYKKDYPK